MQHFKRYFTYWPLIVSSLFAIAMLAAAAWYYLDHTSDKKSGFSVNSVLPSANVSTSANEKFTTDKLAAYDGKDGHKCYVAVDDKVYAIENSAYWQEGEHTTSNGAASCGRDLTEVIKQSPHGKSVLTQLPEVGVYTP